MTTAPPDRSGLVVISGGGSGMGRAIALSQAAAGRDVLVAGRRAEPLAQTAALAGGAHLETVPADLATPAGARAVRAAVGDRPVVGIVAASMP